jgi:hypothetical protein
MKKLLAGGLALGLVGVGGAILAGPTAAQEPDLGVIEHLDAELTPTIVNGGETVTVTSVDPCPQPPEVEAPVTTVAWAYGPAGWLNPDDPNDQPLDFVEEGQAPVAEDGSWEVTFQATQTSGAYEFFAACVPGTAPEGGLDDMVEDAGEAVEETGEAVEEVTPEIQGFAGNGATGGDDHEGPDHTLPTLPCSQQPCDTTTTTEAPPPTEPPPPEPPVLSTFLYGPEAFTVQGAPAPAVPVTDEPEFTG